MADNAPGAEAQGDAGAMGLESRIDALIAAGVDLNNLVDDNGRTPLHFATHKGHVACVVKLIARGADVNLVDDKGRTPLHFATLKGHVACVVELIARGADVHLADDKGRTPLHSSIFRPIASRMTNALTNGASCIAALSAAGARVDCEDQYGTSPLIYAVAAHSPACVAALASAGADINGAFRYALRHGYSRHSIRMLLENGALPDVSGIERNENNESAFQYVDGIVKPALKIAFEMRARDHRQILLGALHKIFDGRYGRVPPEDALAHVARFWMPPGGY